MSLEFAGEVRLPVARERAWAGLNDPELLRRAIVGCTQLERTDPDRFLAVLTARVGPISVTFRGELHIQDPKPPASYTLSAQAKGGAAGFGSMNAHVQLEAISPTETQLRYQAQAQVGGKLASVGQRLIQSVAQKQADDFFQRFTQLLSGQDPDAQTPAVTPSHEASTPTRHATPSAPPAQAGGGLGAPVPAWLVVFGTALGGALGYCLALLRG